MSADGAGSFGREWQPITNLPDDWQKWAATDVQSLSAIWQERRDTALKNSEALKQFNERLAREWAIETGIIEGLYTIDRGTTQVLIEQGIIASLIPHGATDKPAGRIVDILNDHQATLEGIFDFIGRQRELSTSYIKEVHAALTQHQLTTEALDKFNHRVEVELIRGDWKTQPNSPTRPDGDIHQYSPPEHVAAEMDRLVALHRGHDEQGVPPEVEAAWLHHRFTQIHPFQDGNGRVARVLASLVFLRAGWFPLVINRDDRAAYIAALEKADVGDLQELVALFAGIQKRRILQALNLSDVLPIAYLDQMFDAISERLVSRNTTNDGKLNKVFSLADILFNQTRKQFDDTGDRLNLLLNREHGHVSVSQSFGDLTFWNERISRLAEKIGYESNFLVHTHVLLMTISEKTVSQIAVHFHGLGKEFVGVLVAQAIFITRSDDFSISDVSINREPFQFAYNEEIWDVEARYKKWLDEIILLGLDEWRKRL